MGNIHNREVLENAYQLGQNEIDIITKMFTGEELKAVQQIWDSIETLRKPLDDVSMDLYNTHMGTVEADPITMMSADGPIDLAGGYYPLVFDGKLSDQSQSQDIEKNLKQQSQAVLRSSKANADMTKERGAAHSLPPNLSLGVLTRHVQDSSRVIALSRYLRDADRITKDPEWTAMAKKKIGPDMYKELRANLKWQANPNRRIDSFFDKGFDKTKSLATGAILGLNVPVSAKQRLSMLSAAADIGVTPLLKVLADDPVGFIIGNEKSKTWQFCITRSKYLKSREGAIDREINDLLSGIDAFSKSLGEQNWNVLSGILPKAVNDIKFQQVKDAMFFMIQMNDRAATGAVWKAAYMESLEKFQDKSDIDRAHDEAIMYADSIVATTQPTALPGDVARIQQREGAVRFIFSFATWTLKATNRFAYKYDAFQEGAMTRTEYGKHLALELFLAPTGSVMIGWAWALLLGYDDEPPDFETIAWNSAGTLVGGIPLARGISGYVQYDTPLGSSIAFGGVNSMVGTGVALYQGNTDKALYEASKALELSTGIPMFKTFKKVKQISDKLSE